ncbi:Hsp20/alpha crystallin family protein [Thermodesulfatator atlanticus]|uniref:Hsp20/alpha crystallin family protein n=1 Tax=Thermodesulfatator atlanticus TaxID=501497 RepID=UPI0003B630B0|nr:Hsp20/alpha crystallin family protein [Thermodesulfatator atlanticus]
MPIGWGIDFFDPFREFERLQEEVDRLFEFTSPFVPMRTIARGTFPVINIGETNDAVYVYLFAPGIEIDKIDLTIEDNILSISGERDATKALKVEKVDPARYYRQERFNGRFTRAVSLPESIDPSQVEATYQNGIIKVRIAKREEKKAKKIEVKTS